MNYNTHNIDDEFASLFLEQLQNTRIDISKGDKRDDGHDDEGHTGASGTDQDKLKQDLEYLNQHLDFASSPLNIGPASYARYLPLETTFPPSLLDLNDFGLSQAGNFSPLFASGLGAGEPVSTLPNQDLDLNPRTADSEKELAVFDNDSVAQSVVPLPRRIPSTASLATMAPDELDLETNMTGSDLLGKVSDSLLRVFDVENTNKINMCSADNQIQSTLSFEGNVGGRLYTSSETMCLYSNLVLGTGNTGGLPPQLFCYRRNSISISFSLGFQSFLEGARFQKVVIQLYSSLRKRNTDKGDEGGGDTGKSQTVVITDRDDFIFSKLSNETLKPANGRHNGVVRLNQSEHQLTYADLEQDRNLVLFWDQIKFKSATANNRHDAANKFYKIVIDVQVIDDAGEVAGRKVFESNPIIVRGRNPSFYSQKGDILIGRMKKQPTNHSRRPSHPVPGCKRARHSATTGVSLQKSSQEPSVGPLTSLPITPNQAGRSETCDPKEADVHGPAAKALLVQPLHTGPGETADDGAAAKDHCSTTHAKTDTPAAAARHEGSVREDDVEGDMLPTETAAASADSSSYQYFRVDDHYYLPPVDVGYFPHHAHHNKQVFKSNYLSGTMSHSNDIQQRYKYFI